MRAGWGLVFFENILKFRLKMMVVSYVAEILFLRFPHSFFFLFSKAKKTSKQGKLNIFLLYSERFVE